MGLGGRGRKSVRIEHTASAAKKWLNQVLLSSRSAELEEARKRPCFLGSLPAARSLVRSL